MPCPNEVNIPVIFGAYNQARVYGLWDTARNTYKSIGNVPWITGKNAEACIQCGLCESKCPQKLEIPKQLAEAHKALKE